MPRFSIITPVFNSYHLMERFFESLQNQSFKDFEIILVDDCSSDNSFDKLVDFSKKTPLCLKILKSEKNMGPGNARNIGLSNASGEYVTFIDNDDWVSTSLLLKINNIIDETEADCVIYDFFVKKDDTEIVSKSMYDGKTGFVSISDCIRYVRNHAIGKFYKKALIQDIKFPQIKRCEDVAFAARAIERCKKVYYLEEPLYYYYQRPTSLSNNINMGEEDMLIAFSILETNLSERYGEEIKEKSVCDLLYGVVLMMCKANKKNKYIRTYIKGYSKKYQKWYKCRIIKLLSFPKRVFLFFARMRIITLCKILAKLHAKMVG